MPLPVPLPLPELDSPTKSGTAPLGTGTTALGTGTVYRILNRTLVFKEVLLTQEDVNRAETTIAGTRRRKS